MQNRFNLIDEPWIPIVGIGKVGLSQIFSYDMRHKCYELAGTPVQKIAILKLLLAVAQSAFTPRNEEQWKKIGDFEFSEFCKNYLLKWHKKFYLYGENPFLQIKNIEHQNPKKINEFIYEIATGNHSVLFESECERILDDGDKALVLLSLMGFALGGKKVHKDLVLSKNGYEKKSSGVSGPSLSDNQLHNFIVCESLLRTIRLNLLTKDLIEKSGLYQEGLGVAPWEKMPQTEDCETADSLRKSLMGRLIPLNRFCLFVENGAGLADVKDKFAKIYCIEGIKHDNHEAGVVDPTVSFNRNSRKVIKADPQKRPWREIISLLSFVNETSKTNCFFECLQLKCALPRSRDTTKTFAIWSGGVKTKLNAGEQYISADGDFVESIIWIKSDDLGKIWFSILEKEIAYIEKTEKELLCSIINYHKSLNRNIKKEVACKKIQLFWHLCEGNFRKLVDSCDSSPRKQEILDHLRKCTRAYAYCLYDMCCPNHTARQFESWVKNKPNFKCC